MCGMDSDGEIIPWSTDEEPTQSPPSSPSPPSQPSKRQHKCNKENERDCQRRRTKVEHRVEHNPDSPNVLDTPQFELSDPSAQDNIEQRSSDPEDKSVAAEKKKSGEQSISDSSQQQYESEDIGDDWAGGSTSYFYDPIRRQYLLPLYFGRTDKQLYVTDKDGKVKLVQDV